MRWQGQGLTLLILALLGISALPHAKPDAATESLEPAAKLAPRDALTTELRQVLTEVAADCTRRKTLDEHRELTQVAVASVPDPRVSQLSLAFDSAVDALAASAAAAGFSRQRHWFPWKAPGKEQEECKTCKEGRTSEAAKPGWMIFRDGQRDRLLVLFLVTESPVAGVRRDELDSALEQARPLTTLARRYVLGPYFSGSAPSLWGMLGKATPEPVPADAIAIAGSAIGKLDKPSLPEPIPADVLAITGSATGKLDEPSFVKLQRTVVADTDMILFLMDALQARHQEGPPMRIAVLSDSSAYGSSAFAALESWQRQHRKLITAAFTFPLHISQLRAAHEAAPAAGEGTPSLQRTLRLKLETTSSGDSDTWPVMSSVSAFGTELTLASTLREIARRGFQYLIIVATDVADVIYLAREARSYCPRVRLITLSAHALYSHPDLMLDLAGMLVATSYPLILENQVWTQEKGRPTFKSFGNESAQGMYNALHLLLRAQAQELGASPSEVAARFHPLDWSVRPDRTTLLSGPAKWLTELSSGRSWPLLVAAASAESVERPKYKPRPTQLMTGLWALWLLLASAQVLVLICGKQRWTQRIPLVRLFARSLGPPSDVTRQYRACAYLTHALSGFALGLVMLELQLESWMWWAPHAGLGLAATLGIAGVVSMLLATARSLAGLRTLEPGKRLRAGYARLVSLAVSICASALVATYLYNLSSLRAALAGQSSRLLLIRLSDALGMSALSPLLLIAAGLYLWAASSLSRVAAIERFPRHGPLAQSSQLPLATRLSEGGAPLWRARIAALELSVAAPFGLFAWYFWKGLLPNFEWMGFDLLVKGGLLALACTVLFAALHGTVLWNALGRLHARLVATPMVEAYDRIGTKMVGSFGLQFRARVPNTNELKVSIRTCELLAALGLQIKEPPEVAALLEQLSPKLLATAKQLSEKLEHSPSDTSEGQAARDTPAEASQAVSERASPESFAPDPSSAPDASEPDRAYEAHELFFSASRELEAALVKLWKMRAAQPELAMLEDAIKPDKLFAGGEFGAVPTAALLSHSGSPTLRLWTRAAEDFVAMRNATLSYHVIDQIRRCFGFALVGALLGVFAVFSYPFHPPRFVAVSSGLVLCGVVLAALRVIVMMERNELLQRLAHARHDRPIFNGAFLQQVIVYVGLPLLILFARAFPDLGGVAANLLRPIWSLLQ